LINSIKLIIRRNEEQIKRKNPNSNPYLEYYDDEENADNTKKAIKSSLSRVDKENSNATTSSKINSNSSINKNTICQDMIKKKRSR